MIELINTGQYLIDLMAKVANLFNQDFGTVFLGFLPFPIPIDTYWINRLFEGFGIDIQLTFGQVILTSGVIFVIHIKLLSFVLDALRNLFKLVR